MDTGDVLVNVSASQKMGFGSAFMDHDHGRVWLFGCHRGTGCVGTGTPKTEPLPNQGSVHALWSTYLITWHGPVLTDVAWQGPNTATARVRGPTHPSLPPHRFVMLTEGLSVALNNNADGNLTHGWTTLPQCPQSVNPAAGCGDNVSWAYTTCSVEYCSKTDQVLCNHIRLPPLPAAQGLGACPSVKYLPSDGYYYVIFAGAPFVYIVRTRDFVTWEQPQQPFIQPSEDDANTSPYVGNPSTMAKHAPAWYKTLSKWDWNSNDADMCCESWEPSGKVAKALASRKDGQQGWVRDLGAEQPRVCGARGAGAGVIVVEPGDCVAVLLSKVTSANIQRLRFVFFLFVHT
jgi:hypothetical protein